jgi:hypothetical protein
VQFNAWASAARGVVTGTSSLSALIVGSVAHWFHLTPPFDQRPVPLRLLMPLIVVTKLVANTTFAKIEYSQSAKLE